MDWVKSFYTHQKEWGGLFAGGVLDHHRQKVAIVEILAGRGRKTILELGAGGGHNAVAAAELGHQVTAVELVAGAVKRAAELAEALPKGQLTVIEGDFYTVELPAGFDVVCYWDGFGIGSDADQRRLLSRIAGWLKPDGCALIDVYPPWYAASVAGRSWRVGDAMREYGFDADGCRWLDSWWSVEDDDRSNAVIQSLRCYSPVDLRLLLAGTGLRLDQFVTGGTMDWEKGVYVEEAPLEKAIWYTAKLVLT